MKLVAWARAVKSNRRGGAGPVLWLFTDAARLADPRAVVARLPRGMCGVVLRHDGVPDRPELAADLARLCRARGNVLVVAGDVRLACRVAAGVHLRGGRRLPGPRGPCLRTSSAHGVADMYRAWRAGAHFAFLSPAFPTASHPGASWLGAWRWAAMARRAPAGMSVAALGGLAGGGARRLGHACHGVGAIGAFG